jgi:hypothetical protein
LVYQKIPRLPLSNTSLSGFQNFFFMVFLYPNEHAFNFFIFLSMAKGTGRLAHVKLSYGIGGVEDFPRENKQKKSSLQYSLVGLPTFFAAA